MEKFRKDHNVFILQKEYRYCWIVYCSWLLCIVQGASGAFGSIVSLPGECRDVNGKKVEQDAHYVPPGSDVCRLCLCDNGLPKACKAVLCTPPHDCKSFQLGNSCCEFICLDDTLTLNSDKSYDFGL